MVLPLSLFGIKQGANGGDAGARRLTPNKIVDLSGGGASNGIGNTNARNSHLVDSAVYGEKIDEVGSERVLAGEANLKTLGLDEFNDLNGSLSFLSKLCPISAEKPPLRQKTIALTLMM